MHTTILTAHDLRHVIEYVGLDAIMDTMIARLHDALMVYDNRTTFIPARAGCEYEHPYPGLLEWMPAVEFGRRATIKIVGYHPCNPTISSLPTILSTVSVYDTGSGHLVGILDGTLLTALRTGAASAIASRLLASPDSQVVGLIGCGAQAVTQLHALSRVFDIQEVLLHDSDHHAVDSFRSRVAFLNDKSISIRKTDLQDMLGNSDIVCTATSVGNGKGPVFQDTPVKPGLHINAVGSDFPGKTEVPLSLLRRSLVCPDFLDQAVREGECQQLDANQIGPDLVELIRNSQKYQSHRNTPTVFDSTGWALEDHVAGQVMLDYAHQFDLGSLVKLECICDDPKNPYGFLEATGEPDEPGQLSTPNSATEPKVPVLACIVENEPQA